MRLPNAFSEIRGLRVAVFGAGAFGGWTALTLVRQGARVELLDAFGPGNVRASSGGETRVIRAAYGSRRVYTRLTQRARSLWREHERETGARVFTRTGALWLFRGDDAYGRASAAVLEDEGVAFEWLSPEAAAARFPQFTYGDVRRVFYEPDAGYLLARRACEQVAARVEAEGGRVRLAAARTPVRLDGGRAASIELLDGSSVEADLFLFACGPWLGALFPDVVGPRVTPTRQEVFYFGTPPGDTRFTEAELPVWLDFGPRMIYGIPGNAHRGFKLADDAAGPAFDPTTGSRALSEDGIAAMRAFLAHRFPALAGAPCLGGEVCQYEATPDSHLIVDRHPAAGNVWIAGGGSGHGFKLGPALGEVIAAAMMGEPLPEGADWSLARLGDAGRDYEEKWA